MVTNHMVTNHLDTKVKTYSFHLHDTWWAYTMGASGQVLQMQFKRNRVFYVANIGTDISETLQNHDYSHVMPLQQSLT